MIGALPRVGAAVLALLLVGAAPRDTFIPLAGDPSEGLIVPRESPVSFRGFDKYGYAIFHGRFILSGKFAYGCGSECADYNGPVSESDLEIEIEPDAEIIARLPRWKMHRNDMLVVMTRDKQLANRIATARQHRALRNGRIKAVSGRISIVVDEFRTGLECDSANFTARFVAISKPPKFARVEFKGEYGCA